MWADLAVLDHVGWQGGRCGARYIEETSGNLTAATHNTEHTARRGLQSQMGWEIVAPKQASLQSAAAVGTCCMLSQHGKQHNRMARGRSEAGSFAAAASHATYSKQESPI